MLIKSAVASGGKQHPLSTERPQQQQVENHIRYSLGKPNQWEHVENQMHYLNLMWVGFSGVRFELWGRVKLPPPTPCLEPVRLMLET